MSTSRSVSSSPYKRLSPYDQDGNLCVVIETPKGSRNKYKFDPKQNLFTLSKVLPAGSTFPFDFGYIPSTKGQDGDPIDVLILMDDAVFPGCVITARLVGVLKAEQEDDGKMIRNDRLIAIATQAHDHADITSIEQLNPHLLEEIERFFTNYHALSGNKFEAKARLGPKKAHKIVEASIADRRKRTKEKAGK